MNTSDCMLEHTNACTWLPHDQSTHTVEPVRTVQISPHCCLLAYQDCAFLKSSDHSQAAGYECQSNVCPSLNARKRESCTHRPRRLKVNESRHNKLCGWHPATLSKDLGLRSAHKPGSIWMKSQGSDFLAAPGLPTINTRPTAPESPLRSTAWLSSAEDSSISTCKVDDGAA